MRIREWANDEIMKDDNTGGRLGRGEEEEDAGGVESSRETVGI